MDLKYLLRLEFSLEEAAYHEAGHAAIDLLHRVTPQLLLIGEAAGKPPSGACYDPASEQAINSTWRGEKAIAGVLSQTLFRVRRATQPGGTFAIITPVGQLSRHFLATPTASPFYVAAREFATRRLHVVDIGGGFSSHDHVHFMIAVNESVGAGAGGSPGVDAARLAAADRCVTQCLAWLTDLSVWKELDALATALLRAHPTTCRFLHRDDIERVAGSLALYNRRAEQ